MYLWIYGFGPVPDYQSMSAYLEIVLLSYPHGLIGGSLLPTLLPPSTFGDTNAHPFDRLGFPSDLTGSGYFPKPTMFFSCNPCPSDTFFPCAIKV